jgi:hypothetical protein
MQIETRDRGVQDYKALERRAQRALQAALDRFEQSVRRVGVRLIPSSPEDVVCKVQVFCDRGPPLVVEKHAATHEAAIGAAADTVQAALARRLKRSHEHPRTKPTPI